jgi:hypothetical protein
VVLHPWGSPSSNSALCTAQQVLKTPTKLNISYNRIKAASVDDLGVNISYIRCNEIDMKNFEPDTCRANEHAGVRRRSVGGSKLKSRKSWARFQSVGGEGSNL